MILLLASKKQLDYKYTRVIKFCNELKGLLIMAIPFSKGSAASSVMKITVQSGLGKIYIYVNADHDYIRMYLGIWMKGNIHTIKNAYSHQIM